MRFVCIAFIRLSNIPQNPHIVIKSKAEIPDLILNLPRQSTLLLYQTIII
jgi:hypothetical protein